MGQQLLRAHRITNRSKLCCQCMQLSPNFTVAERLNQKLSPNRTEPVVLRHKCGDVTRLWCKWLSSSMELSLYTMMTGGCGGGHSLCRNWLVDALLRKAKLSPRFTANFYLAPRLISLNHLLHWETVFKGPEQNHMCCLLPRKFYFKVP